jgi:hypothetical protein
MSGFEHKTPRGKTLGLRGLSRLMLPGGERRQRALHGQGKWPATGVQRYAGRCAWLLGEAQRAAIQT